MLQMPSYLAFFLFDRKVSAGIFRLSLVARRYSSARLMAAHTPHTKYPTLPCLLWYD